MGAKVGYLSAFWHNMKVFKEMKVVNLQILLTIKLNLVFGI